jgi:hypothetical protein
VRSAWDLPVSIDTVMNNDLLSKIADRLDRNADRLRFTGKIADAEAASQAASRIRAGMSAEEAQVIEAHFLPGISNAIRTRLSALSGSGEYDGGSAATSDQPGGASTLSLNSPDLPPAGQPGQASMGMETISENMQYAAALSQDSYVEPYSGVQYPTNPLLTDPMNGSPSPYYPAGRSVNSYVANPSAALTTRQTPDLYSAFQNFNAFAAPGRFDSSLSPFFPGSGGRVDTSQWLASNGPITPPPESIDSGNGSIYMPVSVLQGQTPIDMVTRNGEQDVHYQITIDGVTYDAYFNDSSTQIPLNMVELVPSSSQAFWNVTAPAPPQPAQPIPAAPASLSGAISQILSGTYANSVLQRQLSSQGQGFYVSPSPDHDLLFNPNATSLVDAMLLASHSPNTALSGAYGAQWAVTMVPILGSVSVWMNPDSSGFSKGLAVVSGVLSLLPLGSEIAGLGNLTEVGGLSSGLETEAEATSLISGSDVGEAAPAINTPSVPAAGNDLLAPGAASGGTVANQIKGIIGNEASVVLFQEVNPGAVLIGKEVGFRVNGMLTEIDNVFVSSEGNLVGIEAKFGQYAGFTPNQAAIYPPGGGWVLGIPEGPAAAEAGLVPGQPTVIYLFRMRFSWPLGGP